MNRVYNLCLYLRFLNEKCSSFSSWPSVIFFFTYNMQINERIRKRLIALQICTCSIYYETNISLSTTLDLVLSMCLYIFTNLLLISNFAWICARISDNRWLNDVRSVKASGNTRFSVVRDAFGLRWDSEYSSRPIGHCHRHCQANGSLRRRLYVCIASKDDEIIRYARWTEFLRSWLGLSESGGVK